MQKRKVVLLFLQVFLILTISNFSLAEEVGNKISADCFYQYDKKLPLNAKEEKVKETEDYIQYHIIYESIHDKEVTALLTLPKKVKPPYPTILWQHGAGDSKEVDYILLGTEKMIEFGFAVLSIDSEYHGERKVDKEGKNLISEIADNPALITEIPNYICTFRDMFIQTVVDLRRAIDYLEERGDIDQEKIGYVGASMGAIMGVVLAGIDNRVKGVISIVGGGGFLETYPLVKAFPQALALLPLADPIYYVDRISPRPLLMINGLKDSIVPEKTAEALFNAAKEPKEIFWFESGHQDIPQDEAMRICKEWFEKYFFVK